MAISRELGLRWSLPRAARVLGRARAAAHKPGVEEIFDEGAQVASEIGFRIELEWIEEDRRAIAAGAT